MREKPEEEELLAVEEENPALKALKEAEENADAGTLKRAREEEAAEDEVKKPLGADGGADAADGRLTSTGGRPAAVAPGARCARAAVRKGRVGVASWVATRGTSRRSSWLEFASVHGWCGACRHDHEEEGPRGLLGVAATWSTQ